MAKKDRSLSAEGISRHLPKALKIGAGALAGGAVAAAAVHELHERQAEKVEHDPGFLLESKFQPYHHAMIQICAELVVWQCLPPRDIIDMSGLSDRSFMHGIVRVVRKGLPHPLVHAVSKDELCSGSQEPATIPHYEATDELIELTARLGGGADYQLAVAEAIQRYEYTQR